MTCAENFSLKLNHTKLVCLYLFNFLKIQLKKRNIVGI